MDTMQRTQTHTFDTDDGRRLAVDVRGPDDGPVVVLHHPAPGSRVLDPDPAVTAAAGIRLVTVDRPGYGGSTLGRAPVTIPGAADDVAHVLEVLGASEAAVVGWSGGGRVAAALAARHPDLVTRVALLATPAPDEDVPWYGEENRAMVEQLRPDIDGAVGVLTEMLGSSGVDPAAAVELLGVGPGDETVIARPGVRAGLEAMLGEAYRQGAVGLAADLAAYTLRPWGFDPRAIGVPVRCWYGAADALVPSPHGQWWVDQVPDGSLEVVADRGHLLPQALWPEVLGWLTA